MAKKKKSACRVLKIGKTYQDVLCSVAQSRTISEARSTLLTEKGGVGNVVGAGWGKMGWGRDRCGGVRWVGLVDGIYCRKKRVRNSTYVSASQPETADGNWPLSPLVASAKSLQENKHRRTV
jgi:hypothetical protein